MTLTEKIISLVPEIVEDTRGFDLGAMAMGGSPTTIGKRKERPITLADVLRAINSQFISVNSRNGDFMFNRINDATGSMDWFYTQEDASRCVWNLTTDLDGQSDDTKAFISKILGV